jgi:hypothetical protein
LNEIFQNCYKRQIFTYIQVITVFEIRCKKLNALYLFLGIFDTLTHNTDLFYLTVFSLNKNEYKETIENKKHCFLLLASCFFFLFKERVI